MLLQKQAGIKGYKTNDIFRLRTCVSLLLLSWNKVDVKLFKNKSYLMSAYCLVWPFANVIFVAKSCGIGLILILKPRTEHTIIKTKYLKIPLALIIIIIWRRKGNRTWITKRFELQYQIITSSFYSRAFIGLTTSFGPAAEGSRVEQFDPLLRHI